MSESVIAHKVPIHITAAPEEVLTTANKLEAANKFSVTWEDEFEEEKFLNSEGYSERTPVWSALTGGSIAGSRRPDSPTQAIILTAAKTKTPFYVHVLTSPAATVGSKGYRYKVFVQSDPQDYEAGTLLKADWALEFSGPPVAI